MQIAVIDDSTFDRENLKNRILHYFSGGGGNSAQVTCYSGAEDFLNSFVPGSAQLLFFDICMNGMYGTEAAKRVRELDQRCLIVFVTTTEEFVFDTFPAHPFEYLKKPFTDERLQQVLQEACRVLSAGEQTVRIRVPHGMVDIPVSAIISVTADDHLLDVHLCSGEMLESSMKFSEMEKLLADVPRFLTVNRGILINMDYTVSIAGGMAHLQDGSIYPVRVREKSRYAALFSQYMISKMQEERL